MPLLGPETLFIGEIHGGDFYNRVPVEARISGIRRFGPTRTWQQIEAEFAALTEPVANATGASVIVELAGNGLGYTVPVTAPIVAALAAGPYPRHSSRSTRHRDQIGDGCQHHRARWRYSGSLLRSKRQYGSCRRRVGRRHRYRKGRAGLRPTGHRISWPDHVRLICIPSNREPVARSPRRICLEGLQPALPHTRTIFGASLTGRDPRESLRGDMTPRKHVRTGHARCAHASMMCIIPGERTLSTSKRRHQLCRY